ncbi:MAG TPA: amidohydrolase family protein [Chitinophagaceae bacterium]|jgi:L-fuconolactonase|nr:amidohydrolase family protein [Chitinophagaceae bacterium]HMU59360.1 amidohydrolase family protein [Chitinophagaceae bacterium]
MQRIIDTHIHIWDFSRADYPWLKGDTSILNRTYSISEIEEERKIAGVTDGVMVQASCNLDDTRLMLEVASQNEWLHGVVCWLPLMNTKETERLLQEEFLPNPYFVGMRHLIHDEPDTEWLLQPAVIESLKLLAKNNKPYDIVGVKPEHIETVLKVAELVPELRMVFDHLNTPPIPAKEKYGRWGELMKVAAQHKNFHAKISGLGTASGSFEDRTTEDIKPYVAFVLEHFGAERCFCGGDWPVSVLANTYSNTWRNTKTILASLLGETELKKVYFTNANRFYNLGL